MLLSFEDHEEIRTLVAKYNYYSDHLDPEGWADVFTEDGVLRHGDAIDARGRQALIEHIDRRRRAGRPHLRMISGNFIIDGEGDEAVMTCYVVAFDITEGLGPPSVIAEYADKLRRVNSRWKFAERNVTVSAGARTWPHYGADDPKLRL